MTILKISLIAVTLVTAVAGATTRAVREGDLEVAASAPKGKRHISPVHYLQPYAGSLQYHRPSVILDNSDYYGESDKGNGGYIVFTHEKGKGYKSKGKGGKGKGGGGYGYDEGNGSSENDGHGGYGGKIKAKGKGYYGKGKGGSYGSSKGKGGSYGKGKGGSLYGSTYVYVSKGKGKGGSYGKGKGGHYGKGKGSGYGSKGKGGSYGKGKGGIPYGSGGYSSYGIGSDGGGSSENNNDQGISHLYGTVIGTSYGVVGNSYGTVGTSYGTIGTSYGTVGDSYGISGVGYNSYGGNGGSSSENNGQDSYGSSGGTGDGPSENDGIRENLAVDSVKEGNIDSAINADGGSGVLESTGTGENQSEGAVTGVNADSGGIESTSVVDAGAESGSGTIGEGNESGSSATGAAAVETSGKKRSTFQSVGEIDETKLTDGDAKVGSSPPASSVTITGGSGPSGKTVYNVAINTKGGTSISNENGNNTFRVDFQTDGAGSGEKAFTVSVHFSSGSNNEEGKYNEKASTLPQIPAILVNRESSTELENQSLLSGKLNDEILSGVKRSVTPLVTKENEAKTSNKKSEKESSSDAGKQVNSDQKNSMSSSNIRGADKETLAPKLKGENRSPGNTTKTPKRNTPGNRGKSDTASGEKGGDGCVSGCLSIPPLSAPSPRSESNLNSGKAIAASQIVSVSSGKLARNKNENERGSSNSSKGSVGSNNPGRISTVLKNSGTEIGNNSSRPTSRIRPLLSMESQTSERVETADNKDSSLNLTRHVPRHRVMPSTDETGIFFSLANNTRHNPRPRPTSKPVADGKDGNDDKIPLSNPLNETTSVSSGRSQRESGNSKQQSTRYLPRNNPIAMTTEGTHFFVNTDTVVVGKNKEETLIKIPKVENAEEKGKRNTAGKDVSSDSIAVPPLVVPYLPVDTYYIPLRRITRGQRKPVAT